MEKEHESLKDKYIRDTRRKENIYEEIFVTYQEIMIKDPNTSKESSRKLLSENSKKLHNLKSKECLQLKNKYYNQEQYLRKVKQQWKIRKKINQLRF